MNSALQSSARICTGTVWSVSLLRPLRRTLVWGAKKNKNHQWTIESNEEKHSQKQQQQQKALFDVMNINTNEAWNKHTKQPIDW